MNTTITLTTNTNETTTLPLTRVVQLLQDQAAAMPIEGDLDLFGETVTVADIARSMRELARVANLYADAIG
jgi:hypothetical protein